jgi:hypothetical protein
VGYSTPFRPAADAANALYHNSLRQVQQKYSRYRPLSPTGTKIAFSPDTSPSVQIAFRLARQYEERTA